MANLRQLNVAASNGELRKVEKLLADKPPLNELNSDGMTPLLYASQAGHADVCRALLAAGADVNCPSNNGHPPLAVAAGNSHPEVVRLLLESGANVNQRNTNDHPMNLGRTPLMHAAMQNNVAVVKLLVEAGADVLAARPNSGHTAIHEAKIWGGKRVLKYLNEVAAERAQCATLTLHEAACNGLADKLRALLPGVVDVDALDQHGQTALKYAAREGHAAVVKLLLEAGASPDYAPDGEPPLVTAAARAQPRVVERLLAAGVDVNVRGRDGAGHTGLTSVQAAAALGNLDTVKVLVQAGADLSLVDDDNQTALDWALKMRRPKIAAYLRAHMGLPAEPTANTRFQEAAEQPAFRAWVERLAALQGRPAYTWKRKGVARFYFSTSRLPALAEHFGVTLAALAAEDRHERLQELLGRLQEEVRLAGYHLVFGQGSNVSPLLLFPTGDKYAVIAAFGTNANRLGNVDGVEMFVGAREIGKWLRALEVQHPFALTDCGFDFLGGRFLSPVTDVDALAARFVEFCPEYESVSEAAAEIAAGRFYFWWD